jgi:RNA polymerase sigma-70 factor (ECF subfamily)
MYRITEGGGLHSGYTTAALSDESLVTAAQRGDHMAYSELRRRHLSQVFKTVHRITRNQEDTEDVVQDAWMKAFQHIKGFGGRSSFSTWLTRIAINSAFMMLRKRKGYPQESLDEQSESGLSTIPEPVERSHNPEALFLETEMQLRVRQAVRRLPLVLREVTEIRQSQDHSVEEIAMITGLSVAATKSRLRRARLVLRERLEPFEGCHVEQAIR